MKQSGGVMKYAAKIATAPFVGLMYIVMLPVGFFFVVLSEVVNLVVKAVSTMLGKDVSFDWRPMEAYFTGKKRKSGSSGSTDPGKK